MEPMGTGSGFVGWAFRQSEQRLDLAIGLSLEVSTWFPVGAK